MDIRLFVVGQPGLYQCGGGDEIGWCFVVILVAFSCLSVLGRSPLGVFARYVRGLLTFPSLILHILELYSIIYCDHTHHSTMREKKDQAIGDRFVNRFEAELQKLKNGLSK